MQITVATISEQGVSFSVFLAGPTFQFTAGNMEELNAELPNEFPRPIIVAKKNGPNLDYFGKKDIVNYLSGLFPNQIPWQTFDIQ